MTVALLAHHIFDVRCCLRQRWVHIVSSLLSHHVLQLHESHEKTIGILKSCWLFYKKLTNLINNSRIKYPLMHTLI